jgi:hypothetical protein
VKSCEGRPQTELVPAVQGRSGAAFAVDGVVPGEPVPLDDDLVGLRWTLTVVGGALLEAGSGPVSPFVLAKAVGD